MNYSFADRVSGLQASAIREILKYCVDPTVISFAAGNPAPDAFPAEELARISAQIMHDNPILALQYNITEGYPALRDYLKKRMNSLNQFNPETDELIITSGAQQANELACKVLCNEGDTLICEAPSFIGSLNSFKSTNVNLVGIELEDDGINLEKLEKAVREAKAMKLLYLIPNFQNPTGLCMSLEKRKAVYELAKKYDFLILEDDPYGEIRFTGKHIPAIKTFDTDGRVLYSGTFSKILAPGLRVGFSSAPKEIIQKMVVCKQVADVHTNIWAQTICHRFMTENNVEEHLEKIRGIYRRKCSLMLEQLDEKLSKKIKFTRPEGGLFIWGTLPDDCDMMSFCKKAVEQKVAIVPGTAFCIHESDKTSSFRLNFSTPTDEQIVVGCDILGKLSRELFGD